MSGDPALSDYIPKAPIDDEAKKHNENLPSMGGVFNVVNLHLYHYAGIGQRSNSELQANNPVKYMEPDGREDDIETIYAKYMDLALSSQKAGSTVAASNINYEKEF
nr:hypothetical protein [Treponema sp. OMZ 855]